MPHHHAFDTAADAARLELEAEVAAALHAQAIDRCRARLDGTAVARIADLGCGPGVAAAALARAFPTATVVGVDGAAAMLERAAARGLQTVRADLDGDLGALGTFELVWASMAIHHADDERAALARCAALVRPGGVLCLLEHASPTAVRSGDDLGRPGLWDRLDAARAARGTHAPGDPDVYPAVLRAAGLELLEDAVLADTARGPAADRFAADRLARELRGLADRLAAADRDALVASSATSAAGNGDARLAGAEVRISRRLLLARRPG